MPETGRGTFCPGSLWLLSASVVPRAVRKLRNKETGKKNKRRKGMKEKKGKEREMGKGRK